MLVMQVSGNASSECMYKYMQVLPVICTNAHGRPVLLEMVSYLFHTDEPHAWFAYLCRWNTWESRLAYYDRSYGALMDEWYEDVLNEGNLDEDTPHEPLEPPGPDEQGDWPDLERDVARYCGMAECLMQEGMTLGSFPMAIMVAPALFVGGEGAVGQLSRSPGLHTVALW